MGVCGIILGIVGLIAAVAATLFFGWIGGAVAIVLGAVAIILGLLKRKKSGKSGVGAVVLGVLAVIVAVSLISTTGTMMSTLKTNLLKEIDQQESKHATVAKYVEMADTNTGFMGFISSMAGKVSEEDKPAFEEEIKDLASLITESSGNSGSKTPGEPAPAEPAAEPADAPAEEPAG